MASSATAPLPWPSPRHQFRIETVAAATWHRVHTYDAASGQFAGNAFNTSGRGNGRFSPMLAGDSLPFVPTLYAAASLEGAIAEVALHDIPTPSLGHIFDWSAAKSGNLHVSAIQLDEVKLVDLRVQGLQRAGLQRREMIDTNPDDYPRTRAWARHLWQSYPEAQGLLWMSRRDETTAAIMLFGDRVPPTAVGQARQPQHIRDFEREVMRILDRLGCVVSDF